MVVDYADARDQLFAQYATILPLTSAIIGETLETLYQGVNTDRKQPTEKFWARVSQQTALEKQSTLSGNDLKRRYNTQGLLFVQLFIPNTAADNYEKGSKLAALIKTAFRGKQTDGCIWFTNVKIQELPNENAWFRINIVAQYQYDEIG